MNVTDKTEAHTISHADIENLCRDQGISADAYFDVLHTNTPIAGTKAEIRWHRVAHEVSLDEPNTEKLLDKLFCLLIDFACTRGEYAAALSKSQTSGRSPSAMPFSALQEKARRLFTSSPTTGEIGELLLYYLTEHSLKHPQILCKFPHKTNPNVHAHGADGVHASVDPDTGHLRLHWGESKLYSKLWDAVDDCFNSLSELILQPPGAKKTRRTDVGLMTDFLDLNDARLEEAFREYLDPDNPLSNKCGICGIALIGFDLSDYAKLTQEVAEKKTEAIAERVTSWSSTIKNSIEKFELLGISMDVFCVPFKSVEDFRGAFLKRLGYTK